MSSSNHKPFVIAMLIAPVLCCVIAIGAFLHVAVSFVEAEEQEKADMQDKGLLLVEEIEARQKELRELDVQIIAFGKKLAEHHGRPEMEHKLRDELCRLLKQKNTLRHELVELNQQLAQVEEEMCSSEQLAVKAREAIAAAKEAIKQTQENVAKASKTVARNEQELTELRSVDDLPTETSQDLENLLARRQASLKSQQQKSQRLVAQLNQLEGKLAAMEKTFRVDRIKSTRSWDSPEPVYVECDADGVILQPAGNRLSANPDTNSQTAFLTAARRTRYVLFLIRPSGFNSFNNYRGIVMSENESQAGSLNYGYEPINEDWTLVYPKPGS